MTHIIIVKRGGPHSWLYAAGSDRKPKMTSLMSQILYFLSGQLTSASNTYISPYLYEDKSSFYQQKVVFCALGHS